MEAFAGIDETPAGSFHDDVVAGLSAREKSLPCKYFYDEQGSRLFDQICTLEEYYPTRTELAIMREHAPSMAAALGPNAGIVELGAGSSVKIRLLLDALEDPAAFFAVDISGDHLRAAAADIAADYPEVQVEAVEADFTRPFQLPVIDREVARRVVYFPGSTIGNFTPSEATALLENVAAAAGPGGALLLGYDRIKDTETLEAAYDDAKGVTAAFNLNLLARINRELGGNFVVEQFAHRAEYDREHNRIVIRIESLCDQVATIDDGRGSRARFTFRAGEMILTEYSHKYSPVTIGALCAKAGLSMVKTWSDPDDLFAVALFEVR